MMFFPIYLRPGLSFHGAAPVSHDDEESLLGTLERPEKRQEIEVYPKTAIDRKLRKEIAGALLLRGCRGFLFFFRRCPFWNQHIKMRVGVYDLFFLLRG